MSNLVIKWSFGAKAQNSIQRISWLNEASIPIIVRCGFMCEYRAVNFWLRMPFFGVWPMAFQLKKKLGWHVHGMASLTKHFPLSDFVFVHCDSHSEKFQNGTSNWSSESKTKRSRCDSTLLETRITFVKHTFCFVYDAFNSVRWLFCTSLFSYC